MPRGIRFEVVELSENNCPYKYSFAMRSRSIIVTLEIGLEVVEVCEKNSLGN